MIVIDIFSFLIAATGWYYLFYSRAAHRLDEVEAARTNAVRVRLRRICGFVMLLLGILVFAGCQKWAEDRAIVSITIWLGVLLLLLVMVILGLIDLRLTWNLRHG